MANALKKALGAGKSRDDIAEVVEKTVQKINVVSDEEASEREEAQEQLELEFDFSYQYNTIAIKDATRAIDTLVLQLIRLRVSRETVNKVLKLIALDNDIIPVVIKKILGKGGE